MRRWTAICLLIVILSTLMTGCWGRRELDEQAFILGIGLDKGTQNQLLVTYQIAVSKQTAGGGSGGGGGGGVGEKTAIVTSLEAPSIFVSMDMMNTYLARRATLMHTKVIVVSEELAREKGVGAWLPAVLRYREARRDVFVLVCRGSAKDFLKQNQPLLEKNVSKFYELIMQSQRCTGFIPVSRLYDFTNGLFLKGDNPVATLVALNPQQIEPADNQGEGVKYIAERSYLAGEMPREGGNKLDFMGSAVFKKDKMVGTLSGDETAVLGMIRDQYRRGFWSLPDPLKPGYNIPLDVRMQRPAIIEHRLLDGRPVLKVTLCLEADLMGVQSGINYADLQLMPIVEQAFSRKIEEIARQMISKTQNEFDSDIFGFGVHFQRSFWTWDEWEKFDWPARYAGAEISVVVKTNIRRVGLQLKSSQVKE